MPSLNELLQAVDQLSLEQKRALKQHLESIESDDAPLKKSELISAFVDQNAVENIQQIVLNAADIGIWMINQDTGAVFWDAQTRYILGVAADEEASLEKGFARMHPDDRELSRSVFEQSLAPGSPGLYHMETRILWPDNSVRWILTRGRVRQVVDGNNSPSTVLVGSVIDITDRKQTEEALLQSEEKYRTLFDLFSQGFCICQMLVDENGKPCDYRFLEVNQLFEENTGLKDAAGKTALELVPNLEPHWVEIYGRIALTGVPLRFEQGSEVMGGRWFDVYAFRIGVPEELRFAIVFNDISKRRLAEERGRMLQILASSLSGAMTQQELVDIIIQKGIKGVGAVSGTVAVLSDNKNHLEMVGDFGYSAATIQRWRQIPLDHPTSLVALAVREQRQLWLHNPDEREQLIPMLHNPTEDSQPQAHAVVPFNINNEFVGVIRLDFKSVREFDQPEQTFLITLIEYCAQALHRGKLTEQIGTLAAAKERQRLSRDLHDSVKQLLFASSTLSESLPRLFERSPDAAKKYTDELVNLNRAALAELQSLLLELRPEAIVTTPFMALVKNLCVGLRGHKAITINTHYDGPEKIHLPVDVHIAFYRLVQETLNNVYKHSEATELDIYCSYDSSRFSITIRDNGKGFDLNNHASGFGMSTMRERAENVGATFQVRSMIGQGTVVTVERLN